MRARRAQELGHLPGFTLQLWVQVGAEWGARLVLGWEHGCLGSLPSLGKAWSLEVGEC